MYMCYIFIADFLYKGHVTIDTHTYNIPMAIKLHMTLWDCIYNKYLYNTYK